MNKLLLSFLFVFPLVLTGQSESEALQQVKRTGPSFQTYMKEYLGGLAYLNKTFFLQNQTGARGLPQGEFTISLNAGGSVFALDENPPGSASVFGGNDNLSYQGSSPSLFGNPDGGNLDFVLINPQTGFAAVNPNTGEEIRFGFELPPGLGLSNGLTPAAAIQFSYGLGRGTEIRAYLTPFLARAAQGEVKDLDFSSEWTYGLQAKHELTTWFPKFRDKGWHAALSGGFGSYQIQLAPAFLEQRYQTPISDQRTLVLENQLSGLDYQLMSYGGELWLSKSFSWLEIALVGSYVSTEAALTTQGQLQVSIEDQDQAVPDAAVVMNELFDFQQERSLSAAGLVLNLGAGWFQSTLNYRYFSADAHFAALGFHFHLNQKKEKNKNKNPVPDED
jgi:hypothetical protein